jgi:hypothetical protein
MKIAIDFSGLMRYIYGIQTFAGQSYHHCRALFLGIVRPSFREGLALLNLRQGPVSLWPIKKEKEQK